MSVEANFWVRFFRDRDDTGRYLIVSRRTGRRYAVEPIDNTPARVGWGDVNPATGDVEGDYGMKHRGSVKESESLVTEENGFLNVVTLEAGESPEAYVERVDAGYPDAVKPS